MTLAEIIANANANSEFIPGMSSNELFFGTSTNDRLTDVIADVAEAVLDKADSDHTHEGYAPSEHSHSGYAPAEHSHNYAAPTHSHTQSDITSLPAALAAKADLVGGMVPASQLPGYIDDVIEGHLEGNLFYERIGDDVDDSVRIIPETGKIYVDIDTNKSYRWSGSVFAEIGGGVALGETAATAYRGDRGKIAYDHSQDGTVHVTETQKETWDSKAAGNHTHTAADVGAAPANHSHSYAPANHEHTAEDVGAFPADGGTINGDTNVVGVLKVNGQQAIYYAPATNSQTIGTGNATGGTTIACGSSANVNINGANVKMPNALPKASNTYYCGNSTLRWKGIYSNAEVNVASDERLKRDIKPLAGDPLAKFIEALNVVSYNYTEDEEGAQARIGLIAQDVQRADAEIAKFFVEADENGMLGMTPANLVFPLIAAVQALSKRVAELEAK